MNGFGWFYAGYFYLYVLIFYFIDMKSLDIFSFVFMVNIKVKSVELVSPEFIAILISLGFILLINFVVVVVKICYCNYSVKRTFV